MSTKIEKCPTCGADAINRSEFWEAYPDNGSELERQFYAIHIAIKKYYLALDNRQHGATAMVKAFQEIEQTIGLNWTPGEVKNFLEAHPKLKPAYGAA